MPIHEYRCKSCGQVSELLVGVGRNSDEVVCKSCGGSAMEALLSAPAPPVMKGSPVGRSHVGGSTCCGGSPSSQGCVPGSCCGASS